MPRGDKSKYTDKQKRKAAHIAEGYKKRGASTKEAKKRAWATVNAIHGGGEKSGSGRGKPENKASGPSLRSGPWHGNLGPTPPPSRPMPRAPSRKGGRARKSPAS